MECQDYSYLIKNDETDKKIKEMRLQRIREKLDLIMNVNH